MKIPLKERILMISGMFIVWIILSTIQLNETRYGYIGYLDKESGSIAILGYIKLIILFFLLNYIFRPYKINWALFTLMAIGISMAVLISILY